MSWLETAIMAWLSLGRERRLAVVNQLLNGPDAEARGLATDLLLAVADIKVKRAEIVFARGEVSASGDGVLTAALEQVAAAHRQGLCDECDPSFGCFDGSQPCRKRSDNANKR